MGGSGQGWTWGLIQRLSQTDSSGVLWSGMDMGTDPPIVSGQAAVESSGQGWTWGQIQRLSQTGSSGELWSEMDMGTDPPIVAGQAAVESSGQGWTWGQIQRLSQDRQQWRALFRDGHGDRYTDCLRTDSSGELWSGTDMGTDQTIASGNSGELWSGMDMGTGTTIVSGQAAVESSGYGLMCKPA